jgi:hypothetical protein
MDHFHAIGILGVAARVERSNKTYFESRGDAAEAKRLEAIIEDYETAIALLQDKPVKAANNMLTVSGECQKGLTT